jgi:hypothetical protein
MAIELLIAALVQAVPALQSVVTGLVDEWAPEDPPMSVLLGAVGRACLALVPLAETSTWGTIAIAIEECLVQGDPDSSTAAATGLLESIDGEAIRRGAGRELRAHLGPAALRFVYDLDVFYGNE